MRGMIGARAGGSHEIGGGNTLDYCIGGRLVHEFEGKATVRFQLGRNAMDLRNDPLDTFGRFEAGVSITGKGPIGGFMQLEGDHSSDYKSYGVRGGFRIAF